MSVSKHPLWRRWCHWRQVCLNRNCADYPKFGGKGIGIGAEFTDFLTFAALVEHHLGYPEEFGPDWKLSRIDQTADYTIANLKWDRSRYVGRRNLKASYLTVGSQTQSIMDWSEQTGINYATIRSRIQLGWTPAEVLEFEPRVLNK